MKKIDEIDLKNKTVIVRVDYNVPIENGKVVSNFRIIKSLKTINYLIEQNCKIILLSHLGKIKTKEDMEDKSLYPVFLELSKFIKTKVIFCNEVYGEKVKEVVNSLESKDVLLLENTRFMDYPNMLESNNDLKFAENLASLADIFVFDAFGTIHRNHASTVGISNYLETCIGYLVLQEIDILDDIKKEKNKTVIMGGAKVDSKIGIIDNLIEKSDNIIIGGAICFTFLKSIGKEVGKSIICEEKIDFAKKLLTKYKEKIILPVDFLVINNEEVNIKTVDNINSDDLICDIGPKSLFIFNEIINKSNLIVLNGGMGKFEDERFIKGTKGILKNLNENNIKTIICGGDTVGLVEKFNYNFYYISTGGGASLEYLEGKKFKLLD